jgi:predicted glycosyltransferase
VRGLAPGSGGGGGGGWEKLVKRSLATLREPAYDVLLIERGPLMPPAQREASKDAGWGYAYRFL